MTVTCAKPGEVIDIKPLGSALATTKTTTLLNTGQMKVIRIVLPTGKEIPEHEAPGEIIVQCLEGRIAFTVSEKTTELEGGQLLYLAAEVPHAVRCLADASFLVTILSGS